MLVPITRPATAYTGPSRLGVIGSYTTVVNTLAMDPDDYGAIVDVRVLELLADVGALAAELATAAAHRDTNVAMAADGHPTEAPPHHIASGTRLERLIATAEQVAQLYEDWDTPRPEAA